MTNIQKKPQTRTSIVGNYLGWLAIRVAALVVFFVLLESAYRFGGFAFCGTEANQLLVYGTIQKGLFSLVVWFCLVLAKKIIIPAALLTVSPALGKIVRDPTSAEKTHKSITQYLTYLVYIIAIVALVLIWAYSFIGTWVADLLGNGLVIMLTFILGLFSSSVLGNVLGYAILGGTNEFKIGDRVQIGDSYGDIIEIGFFFTRIKTIKDEIISIPNLIVMNKEIRNLSTLKEVILYVQITLGYDVDKDQAQRILIESAQKTTGVLFSPDKAPFVLLRELGPFSVTYELNVYTNEPNRIIYIKSDLINNMLSDFKKAGIDTTPPTYIAIKSSDKTLPPPITKYMDSRKTKS
jgi:small-conductance mechanosensitive channel